MQEHLVQAGAFAHEHSAIAFLPHVPMGSLDNDCSYTQGISLRNDTLFLPLYPSPLQALPLLLRRGDEPSPRLP
jgi:hypothetical protein